MINGIHLLLYSREPEADRAFIRDVLGFAHVDVGGGWLIFRLPPAEMAVHPAEGNLTQEHAGQDIAAAAVYLMCDDLEGTLASLASKGVVHTELQQADWGTVTSIPLPGGARLGLYQPRHALAIAVERSF